jgi:ABC-2 type transport system ATP-binding protein
MPRGRRAATIGGVIVTAESLTKRYGGRSVVDGLTFAARPGRVTGFLGPNGSGKTTTLRMLLGLVRPDAGVAGFDGRPYERLARPTTRVGALLEDASFHPGRSGRNHLRVLATAGRHPERRVDELLARVGLTEAAGRRVKGYSLGMRQRLAIAAALLGDPDALVLDEPANGLDPPGIRWMRDLLRAEAARGRAVLVSSHLLAEMAQMADDLIVIADGRLRASGPIEELLRGADGPVTRVRSADDGRLVALLRDRGVDVRANGGGVLHAHGVAPELVGQIAAEHRVALAELGAVSRSLEDAFLELTGGAA